MWVGSYFILRVILWVVSGLVWVLYLNAGMRLFCDTEILLFQDYVWKKDSRGSQTGENNNTFIWKTLFLPYILTSLSSLIWNDGWQELDQGPFTNTEVVVAGLCNIYTHYITTYEEYQVQYTDPYQVLRMVV